MLMVHLTLSQPRRLPAISLSQVQTAFYEELTLVKTVGACDSCAGLIHGAGVTGGTRTRNGPKSMWPETLQ